MNLLEASQIIFNFTFSFVIVLVGVFATIIFIGAVNTIKRAHRSLRSMKEKSDLIYARVNRFLDMASGLAFIGRWFKRKKV